MKFRVSISATSESTSLRFDFEPEPEDTTEGISLNSRGRAVLLSRNSCTFEFPFKMEMPHPDLCAFAALKISSPFIGKRLEMDRPVSRLMAEAIKSEYSNIVDVNLSDNQLPRAGYNTDKVGLAFSGGSDSSAAAYILPNATPLISLVRKQPLDTAPIEPWHNGNQVDAVLKNFPSAQEKIPVHTDFPYTCLDAGGKYVVWADRMWHSVPVILLADHLGLSSVSQGNIMAAFMGDERKFSEPRIKKHHRILLGAIGLDSVQPLAGSSEFISETIVRRNGLKGKTLTCNFGSINDPCMKCIKCLRKSLINHILDGSTPSKAEISRFNNSKRIDTLAAKNIIPLTATLKYVFDKIDMDFHGNVGAIKEKVRQSYPDDASWVRNIYRPFYKSSAQNQEFLRQLNVYADTMSEEQIATVRRLNVA